MAARTLEARRNQALENVEISAHMIRKDFSDTVSTAERLRWTADSLAEAIELQKKIEKRDARKARVAPLQNLGTPLSELPAPVREKIAKLIDDCAPVRWIDASPHPLGAGRWKRPLTWVRIAHGEDKLTGYWLRDDTGATVDSRIIQ